MNNSNRMAGYDGLRGLLALSVMFYHATISTALVDRTFLPGPAAVIVFFVLSGVVLSMKPLQKPGDYKWLPYFASRFIRLFVPVATAILIAMGLDTINHFSVNIENNQSIFNGDIAFNVLQNFDLLFHLSAGGTIDIALNPTSFVNTAVWSMPWEFLFSFLLPIYVLIAYLLLKDRSRARYIATLVITLVIIAIGSFACYYPMVYLPIFFLGVVLSNLKLNRAKLPILEILVLLFAVFCLEAHALFTDAWASFGLYGITEMLYALAAVLLVLLVKAEGIINRFFSLRPMRWLGKMSFSLYLIHLPVFYGLYGLFTIAKIPSDSLLTLVLSIVCAIAAAAIFHRIIEQPSHNLSRKVNAKVHEILYGSE